MTRVHIVLCLWKGWRPVYDFRDVRATARLLRAAGFDRPQDRIVCATNMVPSVWMPPECELAPLWPEPTGPEVRHKPTCFRRLRLFDPVLQAQLGIEPGEIIMSVDLDTIPLPSKHSPMPRLLEALEASDFAAMGGMASRLHGSLWAFRAGSHSNLWTDFDPVKSPAAMHRDGHLRGINRQVGSDQAWMSYRLPLTVPTWGKEQGVYSWNRHHTLSPSWSSNACFWAFAGHHKPRGDLVQQLRPDLYSAYRLAYGEN